MWAVLCCISGAVARMNDGFIEDNERDVSDSEEPENEDGQQRISSDDEQEMLLILLISQDSSDDDADSDRMWKRVFHQLILSKRQIRNSELEILKS